MLNHQLTIPHEKITIFCHKWNVVEFALFGSGLRTDFNKSSDVDVLVTFAPNCQISLFDLAQMKLELQMFFGRQVDLVEKSSLKNPYSKSEIIESAQIMFQPENQP